MLRIPEAPKSIQKGTPLKIVLDQEAVDCLAQNISHVFSGFPTKDFRKAAMENIEPLGIMKRGVHSAKSTSTISPGKVRRFNKSDFGISNAA